MEYNDLKKYVELGFSHRQMAIELNCSQTTVKYWLKKYDLKTRFHLQKREKNVHCILCGNELKDNSRNRSRCNSCTTRIRRYRTKLKAIELLGGKCNRCGWSGNIAAFEFHHSNDDKEYGVGGMWHKSWELMKKEALKCELLCSNCHRIEHTKYDKDENFMTAVNNYNMVT
jgi:predicted transcriptional regulator